MSAACWACGHIHADGPGACHEARCDDECTASLGCPLPWTPERKNDDATPAAHLAADNETEDEMGKMKDIATMADQFEGRYRHTHVSVHDQSPAMQIDDDPLVLMNEDGYAWVAEPGEWEPIETFGRVSRIIEMDGYMGHGLYEVSWAGTLPPGATIDDQGRLLQPHEGGQR